MRGWGIFLIPHSSFLIPNSIFVVGLEFFAVFRCFFVTAVFRLRFCIGVCAVGFIFLVFAHNYDHLSVKECLQVLSKIYIFSEEKVHV